MIPEASFYTCLRSWLDTGEGGHYTAKFAWKNNKLEGASIDAEMVELEQASDTIKAMHDTRDVAENGPDETFPYNELYIWYEHNSVFAHETRIELASAISIVFVIILVMMADFLAPVYVLFMVGFTVLGQLANLHFWGEHLNIVTMINSIMAIGISVDYSAHFMHAFQLTPGDNRVERVTKTYGTIGVGVFSGGFSTFLAILPLTLAETYIFKTFFKCWFSLVIYGIAHALVLLPIILSFIGPSCLERPTTEAEIHSSKETQVRTTRNAVSQDNDSAKE